RVSLGRSQRSGRGSVVCCRFGRRARGERGGDAGARRGRGKWRGCGARVAIPSCIFAAVEWQQEELRGGAFCGAVGEFFRAWWGDLRRFFTGGRGFTAEWGSLNMAGLRSIWV